jgi:Spy/CpxP family protein refolding chaperone
MNDSRGARWQAGVLLTFAFLAGSVTGGALVYAGVRAGREASGPVLMGPPTLLGHGDLPPRYEALGLTDQQKAELGRVVDQSRPHIDSVLNMTLPALRAASDSMEARMRAVLTPEQRRQLDAEGPAHITSGGPH